MTGTYTAADDLAALDRVAALARTAKLGDHGVFNALDHLRVPLIAEQERLCRLGDALWGRDVDLASMRGAALGAEMIAAVASVGAEIVWPSPEVGEEGSGPAAGDTAPGADAAADEVADWKKMSGHVPVALLPSGHIAYRMDSWWREIGLDGRDRGNLLTLPAGAVPMVAEWTAGDR